MEQGKFISGIFSVYDSAAAQSCDDSDRYPLGFEAIFHNDATGKEFAHNLQQLKQRIPSEKGVISLKGTSEDSAREAACFFRDVDTFRQVLQEALPGIGIYHEERGVLPRFALIEEAKEIVAAPVLCR